MNLLSLVLVVVIIPVYQQCVYLGCLNFSVLLQQSSTRDVFQKFYCCGPFDFLGLRIEHSKLSGRVISDKNTLVRHFIKFSSFLLWDVDMHQAAKRSQVAHWR